jgi:hypothetical protein
VFRGGHVFHLGSWCRTSAHLIHLVRWRDDFCLLSSDFVFCSDIRAGRIDGVRSYRNEMAEVISSGGLIFKAK